MYAGYLELSKNGNYPPDYITNLVAKQSKVIIDGFGYESEVTPHASEPTMKLTINDRYLARIIEGCNAVSIIILFIAFIVSFAQQWKKSLLFILAGSTLIYGINVLRIAVLAITLYEYPNYQEVLHGVVFPGIIYGLVFVLWMLWVRMLPTKIDTV